MVAPVLPEGALVGLKAVVQAGMRHRARQWITPEMPQQDSTVLRGTPYLGPEVCCLLKLIGSAEAQIASARGIEAKWSFRVPDELSIPGGTIWVVTVECERQETIRVTGDLVKHGRVMRRVAAVDTTLNKP